MIDEDEDEDEDRGFSTMTNLRDIGEREAIRRLAGLLSAGEGQIVGIGDDTAVVRIEGSGFDWLLTSDPVIEGTHFLPGAARRGVGHKAVGRVLSDMAAMGGDPLWILLNVVAPPETEIADLEEIYRGANELAQAFDAAVLGGDTAAGPGLELHAFGVGRLPHGSAVLRSGAKPGDCIYVTGALGGSLAGKHLAFEPRVTEGLWLREEAWPSAMIDVSDGLVTDLRHIVEMSGAGAEIQADAVPISDAARKQKDDRTPLDHALYDGEDFELLFSVPSGKKEFFESGWSETFELPCTCIGRITDEEGVITCVDPEGNQVPLQENGYEHFTG